MSLLTGLIFQLENGTISFSCLIPSSWGSSGLDGGGADPGTVRERLVRLESPTEAAGPEVHGVLPSSSPLQRPDRDETRGEAGEAAVGDQPCASAATPASPRHQPRRARSKMASWAAVLGEEGINHLLNELIRAQRFHFEEAAGLSLISVALDLRRSGGEGAISNTCSPGDFTAGKWLGLTSPPAQATAPLSRAELKMNGANCSSSCHISREETKPLLTQETMSLCKSQRPTETSPQPRTMQWARVHSALPTSRCHGTPGWPWGSPPSAAAHLPGQLWVSQPRQVPPVTLGVPWTVTDPPAMALPALPPWAMAVVLPHLGLPVAPGWVCPISSLPWHRKRMELHTQPGSGRQEGTEHPTAARLEQQPGR